jgi:hypothetical protein
MSALSTRSLAPFPAALLNFRFFLGDESSPVSEETFKVDGELAVVYRPGRWPRNPRETSCDGAAIGSGGLHPYLAEALASAAVKGVKGGSRARLKSVDARTAARPARPYFGASILTLAAVGSRGAERVASLRRGQQMRKSVAIAYGFIGWISAATASGDLWTQVAPLPDPKWELGAATAGNGRIYAIGGANEFMPQVATVYAYDVGSDTWTQVASMSEIRRHFGSAVGQDGQIYVFSGYHQGFPFFSTTTEVYNPVSNFWSFRADVPTPRQGQAAAAAPDGRIFVMGGGTFGNPIPNVEVYDPGTNLWSQAAGMPRPRTDFGCVTGLDGLIYVFGGYAEPDGYSSSADVYDPLNNVWAALPNMNNIRYGVTGSLGPDGRIYAIGGSLGSGGPTSAEA